MASHPDLRGAKFAVRGFGGTSVLFAIAIAASPALGADFGHREDVSRCFDMTLTVDVRIEDCTKVLQAGLLDRKEALEVVLQLGISYLDKRDFAHAIPAFNTVVNHSAKVPWQAYVERGAAYEMQNQDDLATADYNSAVDVAPENPEPIHLRGLYYLRHAQYAKAINDISTAIKLDSKNASFFDDRAQAYGQLDQSKQVIADEDEAKELDPTLNHAFNGSCWARAATNQDLDVALTDCNEALRLKPSYASALDSRGFVHFRRGELGEALADYEAALKINPSLISSLYMRGIVKIRMGNTNGADDIAAAEKADPKIAAQYANYGVTP